MRILEILLEVAVLLLCISSGLSDMKTGLVRNKTLLVFTMVGIGLDIVYYGFFAPDLAANYVLNVIIISTVSICLFFTHVFAGGDCKLSIVMALLYPGGCYLLFNGRPYTLVITLGFAVFYGYVFLLSSSVKALIQGRTNISSGYIKKYITSFVKAYIIAVIYMSAFNIIFTAINLYYFTIPSEVTLVLSMVIVWVVNHITVLKRYQVIIPILIFDVFMGILLKIVPVSISPQNYLLVLILMLCQMTIRANLYESVSVESLQEGMILSAVSSILMQGSRIKGLPAVSSEDLRDRLNADQIASIKKWAKGNNIDMVTIVKKIPFALFISLGFLTYFGLWRFLL